MLPKIFKPFKSDIDNLIRIGPKKDGGYVIDKRVVKKTNKIISCGLNDDWEFEKEFLKINQDKEIVLFCAGGVRSEMSVKSLIEKGLKNISHIEGGFGSISNSSFKIV